MERVSRFSRTAHNLAHSEAIDKLLEWPKRRRDSETSEKLHKHPPYYYTNGIIKYTV